MLKEKEDAFFSKTEPIKVYDQKEKEVAYKLLSNTEKQKVLSELLFHGALSNIQSEKNVNLFVHEKIMQIYDKFR
jgi:hypothetical protein